MGAERRIRSAGRGTMVSGNFKRPTDTVRRLRTVLLASSALCLASALPAAAQNATWNSAPGSGDFNTAANWDTGTVPTGTAFFGTSSMTALSFSSATTVGGWTFNALSSAYTFTNSQSLSFTGAGIDIQGGSATITNSNFLQFNNTSTAGSATITNNSAVYFNNTSTAGSASITNNNFLQFYNTSTAGAATITNSGNVNFYNTSTAGAATITNSGNLYFNHSSSAGRASILNNLGTISFRDTSTAGSASILNNYGTITFYNSGTAGNASITSNGDVNFNNTSTAGAATISSNGNVNFNNSSSAGSASISSSDTLRFNDSSTAGNASIVNTGGVGFTGSSKAGSARIINNGGGVDFNDTSSAENATITNNAQLRFVGNSTAGSATITNNNQLLFYSNTSAGGAVITNTNQLTFYSNTTAGNATITNSGNVLFDGNSTAGNAQLINTAPGAVINFFTPGPASDGKISAGSLAGNGRFDLNGAELTVGGNNLSTNVTGVLTGTGLVTGNSLIKIGTGTLTLSGTNTYTGATEVNGGTLAVNGSIAASSGVTVNSGGTLGGTGIVGNTTINGGTLAPGNSIGLLTVQGNLVFTAASSYMVEVSPASADRVNVTGTANLGGATVNASFAAGSYVAKQYTIVNATSGLGGSTFGTFVNTNLPSGFKSSLSYDANNAYLDLALAFVAPPNTGLSGNQSGVGNALVNYFNRNGGIPLVYGGLTATGLTQASGETATGGQQTTFNAMTQFLGMMTDPFSAGRGGAAPGAIGFADEGTASAYASTAKSRAARDAYAMFTKAPLAQGYDPRWSAWASGFGGAQTTDGNAATGSNTLSSRIGGVAVGVDYRFAPNTIAGFAMAGGGTNFSVANGGSGRSDLFQAGGFVRHTIGSTYLSGALAYGWQDVTTNRSVMTDQLQAHFNANTFSGRFEAGNRFATSWLGGLGLTPYAAVQFTAIALPAYVESAVAGSNAFALGYAAKTVNDARSELGLRTDKSYAVGDALLTLRGRAAWAHDFNTDRAASATFLALPGASFVVNGAAPARDAALTTASAEMTFISGISLAATFEGEFSQVTRSYAGKGVARYNW